MNATMNFNDNHFNLSEDAAHMRKSLQKGMKITGTCLTKAGDPCKQVNAKGCIVPTNVLKLKHIPLTADGKELFNAWANGDQVLRNALDTAMMEDLRKRLVDSHAERKKRDEASDKEEAQRLGYKCFSKTVPCTNCDAPTRKTYTFNIPGGKRIPYCHLKDCKEARDQFFAKSRTGIAGRKYGVPQGPSGPASLESEQASSVVNTPIMQQQPVASPASPSRSIDSYSEDEFMEKIMDTPDGPFKNALLRKFNQRFGGASDEQASKRRGITRELDQ